MICPQCGYEMKKNIFTVNDVVRKSRLFRILSLKSKTVLKKPCLPLRKKSIRNRLKFPLLPKRNRQMRISLRKEVFSTELLHGNAF